MQEQSRTWKLLQALSFTNKQLAEFVGVSESMIKKIRQWYNIPTPHLEEKIVAFVKQKIKAVHKIIEE